MKYKYGGYMKYIVSAILFCALMIGCNNIGNIASITSTTPNHAISGEAGTVGDGSYDDFIAALYIRETTINPADAAEYAKNYNTPVQNLNYYQVEKPGRVVRQQNGDPTPTQNLTYKQYFNAIGVDNIYVPGSTDAEMFRKMQGATINFLGFAGFQFSEQDVQVLGYYNYFLYIPYPYDKVYLSYYTDLPNSTWADGRQGIFEKDSEGNTFLATDVNRWLGTWNNKNGINSFADLLDPDKQLYVVKDHFTFKHNNIVKLLSTTPGAKPLSDYIGISLYWDKLDPPVSPPAGIPNEVKVTMSGLLAGAHLRGAQGVVDLLVHGKNPADETGTHILEYVYELGNFDTPWGK